MTPWMICRLCMTVLPPDTNTCKCVPQEHLPKTQSLMILHLPEEYEIRKREVMPVKEEVK